MRKIKLDKETILNANLIKGLIDTGVKVIDIGLVTTPMLYYARELFNEPYAVMITASHCAKEYNGFKLSDEEGSMYGDKIQKILNMILKGEYKKSEKGSIEPYDLTLEYKKLMLSFTGYYTEEEIEKAINVCLQMQETSNQNLDGGCKRRVIIPTVIGGEVDIYGTHAYTIVSADDVFTTLVNPHNNSETFTISTIYAKILGYDISMKG